MSSSLQNRGIIKTSTHNASLSTIPIPTLTPDTLLIRTIAVALNPTDWQTLDERMKPGTEYSLLGCDAAGIVVEVGEEMKGKFKVGDKVSGPAHGGNDYNPQDGTFAEYILLNGNLTLHIPSNLSFEEAATLPVGIFTIALGLYKYLHLPLPSLSPEPSAKASAEKPTLLIYGGSTATGTLAIQFAKLANWRIITTSSPHNHALLKNLGADHVFDYRSPDVGKQIRELTKNGLTRVFDTISTEESAKICAAAISSSAVSKSGEEEELIYVNLMGTITFPRPEVKNVFFLAYTVLGETFEIEEEVWDAVPEDFERGKEFKGIVEELVGRGLVKTHPVEIREGGLEGILGGMQDMKEGKVSGRKLVYRVGKVDGE